MWRVADFSTIRCLVNDADLVGWMDAEMNIASKMESVLLCTRGSGGHLLDSMLQDLEGSRGHVLSALASIRTMDDAVTSLEALLPYLVTQGAVGTGSQGGCIPTVDAALSTMCHARDASFARLDCAYESLDAVVKECDRRSKLLEGVVLAQSHYVAAQARSAALARDMAAGAVAVCGRNPVAAVSSLSALYDSPAPTEIPPSKRLRAALEGGSETSVHSPQEGGSRAAARPPDAKRPRVLEMASSATTGSGGGFSAGLSAAPLGSLGAGALSAASSDESGAPAFSARGRPGRLTLVTGGPVAAMAAVWREAASTVQARVADTLAARKTVEDEGSAAEAHADPAEPLYCTCRQVAFGSMIACDDPHCSIEWFHCACVGVASQSAMPKHWLCPACTKKRGASAGDGAGRPHRQAASPGMAGGHGRAGSGAPGSTRPTQQGARGE